MRKPPPTTPSDLPPCRLCSGICPYKVPAIGPDGKPAIMCTEERRRQRQERAKTTPDEDPL